VAPIPLDERHDLVAAHHRRLTGPDREARLRSARAWSQWEGATLSLLPNPQRVEAFGEDSFASTFAVIEAHYFVNKGFFAEDGWLLKNVGVLRNVPGYIIQGRYDVVTPPTSAYALHKAWPEAHFEIVSDAGHTATEPGLTDALIRATAAVKTIL
jgi:proline iminopeptidase